MRVTGPSFVFMMVLSLPVAAQVEPATAPPRAISRPVEDDYFGTKVVDRFRYMESRDEETTAWMKAQSRWAHSILDSIAPKAAYQVKMARFGAQFGVVSATAAAGQRIFYLERVPGADQFDLKVKDGAAVRTLVDTTALIRISGSPHAVDWFTPSPDGTKVAVGISAGGSENSQLTIIDAISGRTIGGPIDRAQYGSVSWLPDGSGLFFPQLQKLGPNPKPTDKYQNISAVFWDLRNEVSRLVRPAMPGSPIADVNVAPVLWQVPQSPTVVLAAQNGVENEVRLWWGDGAAVRAGTARWTPFVDTADGVTRYDSNGRVLYLLTHKDAPHFKVIAVPIGGSLAQARTIVPARDDVLIETIAAAADGLYVAAREGLYSKLLRVSENGAIKESPCPSEARSRVLPPIL